MSTTANGSCRRATTRARPAARHRSRRSARRCWPQLVAAFKDDQGHPIAQSAAQALKLARELGGLLDELAIEGVRVRQAGRPGRRQFRRATGGARSTSSPSSATHWPAMLAERGQIDAIERRTQAIRAQAARWRRASAHDAGDRRRLDRLATRDARPAGRHRRSCRRAPSSCPASIARWTRRAGTKLDPSHPQFGLRELLVALGSHARRRAGLARQPRRDLGAPQAGRRADAAGRDQRGLVSARSRGARSRDPRRLRHAAPGGAGDRAGAARGAGTAGAAPPPWSRPTANSRDASRPS